MANSRASAQVTKKHLLALHAKRKRATKQAALPLYIRNYNATIRYAEIFHNRFCSSFQEKLKYINKNYF